MLCHHIQSTMMISLLLFVKVSSFFSYNHLSSRSCFCVASLDSTSLPNNFHEVLSHLGWHSALIEEMEMDALNGNGTWDLA